MARTCSQDARIALRWTPQGKRQRGRPRTTWCRTIVSELKELGMTWGEAETKANDRTGWRNLVATLCSDGSEEDREELLVLFSICQIDL